jgi:hypothetical protein
MRARTGTLVERSAGWFARLTVDLPDGKSERRLINLETGDRTLAERKLAKLVASAAKGRK